MATQATAAQLSVVPGAETYREIENTIDAQKKLGDALAELKKKRAEADTELAQTLCKGLTAGPINIDSAVEKLKATRSKQESIDLKIKACEELCCIVDAPIQEQKHTHPERLRNVVQAKLEQLENSWRMKRHNGVPAQRAVQRAQVPAQGLRFEPDMNEEFFY